MTADDFVVLTGLSATVEVLRAIEAGQVSDDDLIELMRRAEVARTEGRHPATIKGERYWTYPLHTATMADVRALQF